MPTSSMTSASIRFPSKQREPLLIISFALVSMQNNIHDFHSMGGSYRTGQIQHRQLPAWSRRKPCSFLPADSCRLAGGTSLSSCCQCTLPHRLAPLSMSRWDWSVSSVSYTHLRTAREYHAFHPAIRSMPEPNGHRVR